MRVLGDAGTGWEAFPPELPGESGGEAALRLAPWPAAGYPAYAGMNFDENCADIGFFVLVGSRYGLLAGASS
jgi:hypothetical protein